MGKVYTVKVRCTSYEVRKVMATDLAEAVEKFYFESMGELVHSGSPRYDIVWMAEGKSED